MKNSSSGLFPGGGEMGLKIRSIDWSETPLGPISGWPRSLITAVDICLGSGFPMLLMWGPEMVIIYNDAYGDLPGMEAFSLEPGRSGCDVFRSNWDILGPELDKIYMGGESEFRIEHILHGGREGSLGGGCFIFSYVRIADESGGTGGILNTVNEKISRSLFGGSDKNHGSTAEAVIFRKELTGRVNDNILMKQWSDGFKYCAHGIAVGNPQGSIIITCNPAFSKLLGRRTEDIIGSPILNVYAPSEREYVLEQIRKADSTGHAQYETAILRDDGSLLPVQIDLVSVYDSSGAVLYRIATTQDISIHRSMEETLRKSEKSARKRSEELQTLVQAIPSAVWFSYDPLCSVITGNSAAREVLGLTVDHDNLSASTYGNADREYEVWRDGVLLEPEEMTMQLSISTGRSIYGDKLMIVRADKSVRWVLANAIPLFNDGGGIRGCICVAMDITAMKKSEKLLSDSERKYRQLFETESDALFLVDEERLEIIDVNTATTEMYGYTRQELLGKCVTEISAEPQKTRSAIKERSDDARIRWHRKKDGTLFPVEITGSYFILNDRRVHLAAIRDITQRISFEKELEAKTESLVEVNAALRALLRQRDEDRKEFEENVVTNIRHHVVPYMENLRKSQLTENQKNWLEILEAQLNGLTSSFTRRLTLGELNFSNAELRVAALVREGKSTKEIAGSLMISEKTVSCHRDNIRKKLGLRGKKGGLRYILMNLCK